MIRLEGFHGATWYKSVRSPSSQDCIAVTRMGGLSAIRDSKNPAGPVIVMPNAVFDCLLTLIKTGFLDVTQRTAVAIYLNDGGMADISQSPHRSVATARTSRS
jgi:hypothetical protein